MKRLRLLYNLSVELRPPAPLVGGLAKEKAHPAAKASL